MLETCALCQVAAELQMSHIIPAFVAKWIKETSATGFLRGGKAPNRRVQDGEQRKLLCRSCEDLFGKNERVFANEIFYPYVNEVLSKTGTIQKNVRFSYDDWLLKFVISLHWRTLITQREVVDRLEPGFQTLLIEIEKDWRQFLLGQQSVTGRGQTYMLFLQSLAEGIGVLPARTPANVNTYLLRLSDGTVVGSKTKLGMYSKIGPIAFFTTLEPRRLKDTDDLRVGMRGAIWTVQSIRNTDLTEYVCITAPSQVLERMKLSPEQQDKVAKAYENNPKRAAESLSVAAGMADAIIRAKKKEGGDEV